MIISYCKNAFMNSRAGSIVRSGWEIFVPSVGQDSEPGADCAFSKHFLKTVSYCVSLCSVVLLVAVQSNIMYSRNLSSLSNFTYALPVNVCSSLNFTLNVSPICFPFYCSSVLMCLGVLSLMMERSGVSGWIGNCLKFLHEKGAFLVLALGFCQAIFLMCIGCASGLSSFLMVSCIILIFKNKENVSKSLLMAVMSLCTMFLCRFFYSEKNSLICQSTLSMEEKLEMVKNSSTRTCVKWFANCMIGLAGVVSRNPCKSAAVLAATVAIVKNGPDIVEKTKKGKDAVFFKLCSIKDKACALFDSDEDDVECVNSEEAVNDAGGNGSESIVALEASGNTAADNSNTEEEVVVIAEENYDGDENDDSFGGLLAALLMI